MSNSGGGSQTRFGCYIGNIDRSVTLDMLKQVFCQCGTIVDCSLNGRDEDPYRYGFIDFSSEDDRARAMKYNGFTLVGRKLKVGVSKGNVNRPDGYDQTSAGAIGGVGRGGHSGGNSSNNNRGGAGSNNGSQMSMNGGGGRLSSNGLTPQQQMEAQIILQLLQQGTMDPRQLTPAQQELLMTSLVQGNSSGNTSNNNAGTSMSNNGNGSNGGNSSNGGAMGMMMNGPAAMPQQQQPVPMQQQQQMVPPMGSMMQPGSNMGGLGGAPGMYPNPMMPPMGWGPMPMNQMGGNHRGYGGNGSHGRGAGGNGGSGNGSGGGSYGNGMAPAGGGGGGAAAAAGFHRGPANPVPSDETLRLREKQREQYYDVVRKEAEKYEKKIKEKLGLDTSSAAPVNTNISDDSSASDDEAEKPAKKAKRDESPEATAAAKEE